MSHETYRKACAITAAAKADPEKYGHLPEKLDQTRNVSGVYRELVRLQRGIDRFTEGVERLGASLESVERRLYKLLTSSDQRLNVKGAKYLQNRLDGIQKLLDGV